MFALPPADSRRAAALALLPLVAALTAARLTPDAYWVAWVAFVPALLWAGAAPSRKKFALLAYLALVVVELATKSFLRHLYPPLGYVAVLASALYFAVYPALWLAAAREVLPRLRHAAFPARASASLALAGLWIALEWLQGHLFTGCPWMLLGATQWHALPLLSLCAYTGPWGPSFAIILFNLGLARYAIWLTRANADTLARTRLPASPWQGLRFCPDFYLGLVPVAVALSLFFKDISRRRDTDETLFTAAAVQTDFDPNAKWVEGRANEHLRVATRLTHAAAALAPKSPATVWPNGERPAATDTPPVAPRERVDFILWPEAAVPFAVGTPDFDGYLADLAKDTDTTLLVGAIARGATAHDYYNSIHAVSPEHGLDPVFYAKRHLVPFGEYVPFASVLPLRKIVPIPHDCARGENHEPLRVARRDGTVLRLGALVCYEDIFPELALDHARRGADALLVVTNDAWYGRESGAYQHAASCALLAASTGLPVARCGNAGWSGAIAPNGHPAPVLDRATGSVYFRGAGRFEVRGTPAARREPTFFVRHGDWFPAIGAALAGLTALRLRRQRAADAPATPR